VLKSVDQAKLSESVVNIFKFLSHQTKKHDLNFSRVFKCGDVVTFGKSLSNSKNNSFFDNQI